MDVAGAKKLVEWARKGNTLESFPQDGKTEVKKGTKNQRFDPADPLAPLWQALPRTVQVRKTPKGYRAVLNLSPDSAALALYGAMAAVEEGKRSRGVGFDPRYRRESNGPVHEPQWVVSHKLASPPKLQPRRGVTTSNSSLRTSNPAAPAAAKTIPAWAQEVLPAAGEFANHFYGIGYTNWDENLNYLKSQMVGDGA